MPPAVNHSRSGRHFTKGYITMDNKRIGAHTLRCSTDGCRFSSDVIDRSDKQLPDDLIKRKFEQKGWLVGQRETADLCPDCHNKLRAERRAKRNRVVINASDVFRQIAPAPEQHQGESVTVTAEEPAPMGREDRRIIFQKLNEVYLNDKEGYSTPWTDKKVASDLGVPVAWVATIRDENFGPAADNQEVRELLAKVEQIAADTKATLTEALKLHAEITSKIGTANNLNSSIQGYTRQLDALNTQASRIRASLEP